MSIEIEMKQTRREKSLDFNITARWSDINRLGLQSVCWWERHTSTLDREESDSHSHLSVINSQVWLVRNIKYTWHNSLVNDAFADHALSEVIWKIIQIISMTWNANCSKWIFHAQSFINKSRWFFCIESTQ